MTNTERTVYIIELRDRFTRGVDKATAATKRFNRSTDAMKKQTKMLESGFRKMGTAAKWGFGLAAAGMTALGVTAIKTAAKFEVVEKALEVMTGRKGLGAGLFNWAKEFSRTTIITFDQTVTTVRKLLAYGVSSQNVKPLTAMLSEIAAGVGTDRLPYLTLALGQVKSRGRLMGTELRQFREHGVDIISELAKGLTQATGKLVNTSTVEDMVTKGLVSFDMVVAAMESMVGEGGRFYKMLEEMAKTTTGKFNILKSSWAIAMDDIGKMLLPIVNNVLEYVTPAVEKLSRIDWSPIKVGFNSFVETLDRMQALFGMENSIFRTAFNRFATMLYGVADLFDDTAVAAEIFSLAFDKLGLKIDALGELMSAWASFDMDRRAKSLKDFWSAGEDQSLLQQLAREEYNLRKLARNNALAELIKNSFNPSAAGALDTGKYKKSGTNLVNTDDDPNGSKSRTNKLTGTGARDIVITIGNMVEQMNINSETMEYSLEEMRERLRRTLLTVINDTSQLAQ